MSSIRLKGHVEDDQKKHLYRLAAAAGVFLCASIAVYASKDHAAPEIDFSNVSALYEEEDLQNPEFFLKGVTAADKVDGDVTDRIYIKSISRNSEKSLTVYYAVSDFSGNMSHDSRIFQLKNQAVFGDSQNGGIIAIEQTTEADTKENEEQTQETEEESASDHTENGETPEGDIPPEETTLDPADEPVVPSETTPAESSENTADNPVADPGSEIPTISLTASEIFIPAGSTFKYTDYIAAISDDKLTTEELYENIWIEGWENFDVNTPGTYPLIYHAVDYDHNASEGQTLTVYVQ